VAGYADLRHYYGFTGAFVERIVSGRPTTEEEVQEFERLPGGGL
jgi:hypothetical protein